MNNYIKELKATKYCFSGEIDDIYQMSGGTKSKIYPFLNYVAMTMLEIRGHKRSNDHDECKRKGMEFLIENVNCLIEKDLFASGFDAYSITYEKDEGETMPFSRMKMRGMHTIVGRQYNGLISSFFDAAPHVLTDTIQNDFACDEYAYSLMKAIILTSKYYVADIIKGYGKYIRILPSTRELGRAIKETPRLSTFSTSLLSRESLRLKLLSSDVGDGEYVYTGVMHNKCERTTEYFIKKDNTLMSIHSAPNHMNITREDLPFSIPFNAYMIMEDIHGEDMARAVKAYEQEASTHKAMLEMMASQHKRTLELLNKS